jgi:hypothetical protein
MAMSSQRRVTCRKDANHDEIMHTLKAIGCLVVDIHNMGGGIGDLLIAYRSRWLLIEIKDGHKPPSARKLTPEEKEFHQKCLLFNAPILTVLSSCDAVAQVQGATS